MQSDVHHQESSEVTEPNVDNNVNHLTDEPVNPVRVGGAHGP